MQVEIGDRVFELEKPSGYKLMKAVSEDKDAADTTRDLILLTVKEPKLTKEEVEELEPEVFFALAAKINEMLEPELKNLKISTRSAKK